MGYFIAVNKETGKILTSGQSIYGYESSARKGIGAFVRKVNREKYAVVEITDADVSAILARNGINAEGN